MSTHYFRFTQRGAVNRQRSPLLERLLTGADSEVPVSDWRADAFRVLASPMIAMPSVAAVAAASTLAAGPPAAGTVFIATPVQYVAQMSNVRLPADGVLTLRRPESLALAADFNRVWDDAGIRLLTGQCAELFCVCGQTIAALTRDPQDVLDRYIEDYLPADASPGAGGGAPRLRQLMSEIEMWLFEHAVNRARVAAGETTVSALWLWGGGPALAALPRVDGWTAGDDLFFKAFASGSDLPRDATSAVIVVEAQPESAEWRAAESRWLERSVADLRAGRIARLALSGGNRCFSIGAGWRRRFWRRPRPWWEFFA